MRTDRFLFIVAHPSLGRIGRISLSNRSVHAALVAAGICLVALLGFAAELYRATTENRRLNAENDALRAVGQSMAMTIDERGRQIESLSSLAYHVSIAYGIRRDGVAAHPGPAGDAPSLYYTSLSQFDRLQAAIDHGSASELLANTTPSIWPVRGRITSAFGKRTDPFSGSSAFHPGMDISAPNGTPVWATADGIVVGTGWESGGLGRTIAISHGRAGFGTRYGHLKDSLVRVGQVVRRGEVIGSVGATGRTTGNHVHYEVTYRGLTVNPYKYLRARNFVEPTRLTD